MIWVAFATSEAALAAASFVVGRFYGQRRRTPTSARYFVVADSQVVLRGIFTSRRAAERAKRRYQAQHPDTRAEVWGASWV